jgi:hypothetical protein
VNFPQQFAGFCPYFGDHPVGAFTLLVALPCVIGDWPDREMALLDTAAEWCVLPPTLAEGLGLPLLTSDPPTVLDTRFGRLMGRLERIPVRFIPQRGEFLTVEATWFVSPDWPGPVVLGWKGCLERIRFATDPNEERFYFAAL